MSAGRGHGTPLQGWTRFAWADLVLSAVDPDGRRWSVGDLEQQPSGDWELQLSDGKTVWWTSTAPTVAQTKRMAAIAVEALGGAWPTVEEEVLADITDHPGTGLGPIVSRTGLEYDTARYAVQRLRRGGAITARGARSAARWYAAPVPAPPAATVQPAAPVAAPSEPAPEADPSLAVGRAVVGVLRALRELGAAVRGAL